MKFNLKIIDQSKFILKNEDFFHLSAIHGVNHTFRVMFYILLLDEKINFKKEAYLAFCAAFIHDLSRRHDGYCTKHGEWAVKEKLPKYQHFFNAIGLNDQDLQLVSVAIKYHSIPEELSKDHAAYIVTAILKDADALDRLRLGDDRLDIKFLRFKESHDFIELARNLIKKSQYSKHTLFKTFYDEFISLI